VYYLAIHYIIMYLFLMHPCILYGSRVPWAEGSIWGTSLEHIVKGHKH
jgi:hypothetical protein